MINIDIDLTALKGKTIRNFKGSMYLLIDIAEHTETGEKMVIYKALYGSCKLYVRPLKMFLEKVPKDKINITGQRYRFEPIVVSSVYYDKEVADGY